tara:strand:- start:719 stop:1939 length:1221 start_codon:yes stop_codon:yes gene_type:complete
MNKKPRPHFEGAKQACIESQTKETPDMDLSGLFCLQPWENCEVTRGGIVKCCCSYWMPDNFGNLKESSLEETMNSDKAQKIRESILDGSYRFCNKAGCEVIQSNKLIPIEDILNPDIEKIETPQGLKLNPKEKKHYADIITNKKTKVGPEHSPTALRSVNFLWDESCNLECPSCRIGKILYVDGSIYQQSLDIQEKVMKYVFDNYNGQRIKFTITGSGDPFGSKIFRDFLINFDGKQWPNINILFITNGVMFTKKMWNLMSKCQDNIMGAKISIDAATEKTYKITRPPGNWNQLMTNLKMISELRQDKSVVLRYLQFIFVVQKDNFREMADFVRMGESFGVDQVMFKMLADWGTWDRETFQKNAIWMSDNKYYEEFMESLRDPIFKKSIVNFGNLNSFFRKANDGV